MLEGNGIECDIYDQRIEGETQVPVENYDFVFVTSSPLDRWQCPNLDLEIFAERITGLPEDRTYVLGAHGTMDPESVVRTIGMAGVIREEPEIPVLKIALGEDKRTIPGLSYFAHGEVISNPTHRPPSMDDLASPAYHLVDLSHYSYELLGENFALLETSRGCPHSCTYCYLGMYPKYRLKSPQRVVEEVETVLGIAPGSNIYFIDLEFAIHRSHTHAVLEALIDSGLQFRWCCQTRADSVDLETLRKMKQAGCRLVHYGVETGSQRIMDMVNKRLAFEKIRLAIQLTREVGLDSACFFMMGFPTESEEEIGQTVSLATELNPTYASFHIATPYPGTPMYEGFQVHQDGHFIEERYEKALPLPRLKKLERKAYLQYYLRPEYMLSQLIMNPRGSWRRARLFWEFLAAV